MEILKRYWIIGKAIRSDNAILLSRKAPLILPDIVRAKSYKEDSRNSLRSKLIEF